MSIVGTRPPTLDEWNKYELHHRARLRVDDCIGKKMTFLHDPDGCRRDCMNKVGREKAI